MEPRIQFATTDDDVSLAYWELGEGMPLVLMPALPFTHLQLEWQMPAWRSFYERLLEEYRVIRYDSRGTGLSDRDQVATTFAAHLADLEAVVEHLGLERFAIFAIAHAGPVAIQYASVFPDRVSHLVLWCSYPRNQSPPPELDWERPLLRASWRLYTETLARAAASWSTPDAARHLAEIMRESITPAAQHAVLDVFETADVSDEMREVQVPTLVMRRRNVTMVDPMASQKLAAGIPAARLAVLEGDSIAPFLGDMESVLATLRGFLTPAVPLRRQLEAGLRTLLFTDLESHTEMMQRLGDLGGREVLREHERLTREALTEFGGSEVKAMGDGFLASFASAQRALECAIALQQRCARFSEQGIPLRLRIGLNAGEPIAEDNDLFGASVIAAARIAGQAAGGEILVANVVRELVAGKGFLFADRGETVLRGFDDPVRIWQVKWE